MECKRCGASLPSSGYICRQCGTMMDEEQIKEQKKWMEMEDNKKSAVKLMSSKYNVNKDGFTYETPKGENKLLGAVIIIVVLLVVIAIAIAKLLS